MSTVYIVQEPLRRSPVDQSVGLKYSLEPARRFGELKVLLAWDDVRHPIRIDAIVTKLRVALRGFTEDDYLLASGNPAAIAAAAMLASQETNGIVRLLVWDNRRMEYEVLLIDTDVQPVEFR